jgi:hypothetical protein
LLDQASQVAEKRQTTEDTEEHRGFLIRPLCAPLCSLWLMNQEPDNDSICFTVD